jgi:gamma-glutamyltranspeptidase / glutathione hydrolase
MRPNRLIVFIIIALLLFTQIEPRAASPVPVRGRHGMVASASEIASAVGVEILKRGGNAVDAAVAVGLALAVTYPRAGNLGGGGFMLIRLADGRSVAIDYRETAPAGASRNMYLDKEGNLIPKASQLGYLAAGVPGTVAGFSLALEKYGTMKWQDVIEPARRLAAEGFPVSYTFARGLRKESERLEKFPESRRIFLKDGKFYEEGESFKQPELAETLLRLKKRGPREFYEGRTAQLIAEEMQANGGLITLEDLKNYKPVSREPLRGTYRGHEIITMPPPSSGGIVLLEMLNVLEHYDLSAMGHNSSEKYHVLIETMRRAFADRAEFMGDPDFVKVPVAALTSKRYAADIQRSIDINKATPSNQVRHGRPTGYESSETTHYTVVDQMGNAVSNTYTLNDSYGNAVTVRGTGILLNNEMDDFAAKPGEPNLYKLIQGEANAIAPGKRPLSSMTPTIVLKEGKLLFVVGSPGGPTIINTVLQVILNIVDHEMNIQQAIDAPRLHHQWLPDQVKYEPYGLARDVMEALKAKGHQFKLDTDSPYMGDAEGVMIEPLTGMRLGASDPRSGDARAVGF